MLRWPLQRLRSRSVKPTLAGMKETVSVLSHRQRIGRRAALSLTTLRLLIGPGLVVGALTGVSGRLLAIAIVVAAISDIVDGVIARRTGVAAPDLRRFDSIADTVCCLSAGLAVWMLHAPIVRAHSMLVAVVLTMQVVGHAFDVAKFGRDTSYHTWSGRLWGLTLFTSLTFIFATGDAGPWLNVALYCGIASHIDAFVITMILPEWRHDVRTIANALRIRHAAR